MFLRAVLPEIAPNLSPAEADEAVAVWRRALALLAPRGRGWLEGLVMRAPWWNAQAGKFAALVRAADDVLCFPRRCGPDSPETTYEVVGVRGGRVAARMTLVTDGSSLRCEAEATVGVALAAWHAPGPGPGAAMAWRGALRRFVAWLEARSGVLGGREKRLVAEAFSAGARRMARRTQRLAAVRLVGPDGDAWGFLRHVSEPYAFAAGGRGRSAPSSGCAGARPPSPCPPSPI